MDYAYNDFYWSFISKYTDICYVLLLHDRHV